MDVLDQLRDLHKQATVERSHHYTGAIVSAAMIEIGMLRAALRIARLHAPLIRLAPERRHTIKVLDDVLGGGDGQRADGETTK